MGKVMHADESLDEIVRDIKSKKKDDFVIVSINGDSSKDIDRYRSTLLDYARSQGITGSSLKTEDGYEKLLRGIELDYIVVHDADKMQTEKMSRELFERSPETKIYLFTSYVDSVSELEKEYDFIVSHK